MVGVDDNNQLRQRENREGFAPLMHNDDDSELMNGDTNDDSSSLVDDNNDDNSHSHHHVHTKEEAALSSCCSKLSPGSISNLCSATLGAGALSLPYAISLTGIMVGVLSLLLSAYLTIISINIIIEACVSTQLNKFEDVSKRLVGSSLSFALEASLLVFCFGTAVAYIVAVGDILDQGFHSITFLWEQGSTFASLYSRERVMVLFWAIIMLPLSLQTKLKRLEKFSSLGVCSIIFLVIACVIHSIIHGDTLGSGEYHSQKSKSTTSVPSLLWPKSFAGILQAFPIIIFAFSCQVNVCAIYEELKPSLLSSAEDVSDRSSNNVPTTLQLLQTKQRMIRDITRNGILLCMTLYLMIGIFGYLDFTTSTTDDILVNYCIHITHDLLMTAATFSVFVAVVVAFPFNILPARVTLKLIFDRLKAKRGRGLCSMATNLLPRNHDRTSDERSMSSSFEIDSSSANDSTMEPLLEEDQLRDQPTSVVEHVLITLLLSGGALIVAIMVPGISIVFGLMGGTAASIISFILPGMFALKIRGRESRVGKVFVCGGLVIGILTTGTTVIGIFNSETAADGGACPQEF